MFSNIRRTRKIWKTYFVSNLFFFLINIKTLNLKNKKEFSDNTFLVFFMFSKTILKNNFQKHEPNICEELESFRSYLSIASVKSSSSSKVPYAS